MDFMLKSNNLMLVTLTENHKQHLSLLISQPNQVLVDFCRLALEYLQHGPNEKKYSTAAEKLEVTANHIQNAVEGIVNLLVQCARHNLDVTELRDTALLLGFDEDKSNVFARFYKNRCKDIKKTLSKFSVMSTHYQDLDWRFEVEISSRSLLHQTKPRVTMELSLQNKPDGFNFSSKNQESTKKILLQADMKSIQELTKSLEQALSLHKSMPFKHLQRRLTQSNSAR